jgi:hypothetical protein
LPSLIFIAPQPAAFVRRPIYDSKATRNWISNSTTFGDEDWFHCLMPPGVSVFKK